MPKNDAPRIAPHDKDERVRFFIERGNALLREAKRPDLHWVYKGPRHLDGSYKDEPGEYTVETRRAMQI